MKKCPPQVALSPGYKFIKGYDIDMHLNFQT